MNTTHYQLGESLKTGFIDRSLPASKDYLPQLLVNDKTEGRKVLTTIIKELNNCDEFWLSVAFVTTSGVATLINTLSDLKSKGIKGKILVSQYLNFTQPEALKRLLQFDNIEVRIEIEDNFHSKGYLFKKGEVYDLIIGSSNLTANALCSNVEWNLKITATPISYIIFNAVKEFSSKFEKAVIVNSFFIDNYSLLYKKQFDYVKALRGEVLGYSQKKVTPNLMQREALHNLKQLRLQGKNKALLISATGTGKTYLSGFDAEIVNPKRLLFVVHRLNIAEASRKTYQLIFGESKTTGIYSGNQKELEADLIFSTIQTICKEENLAQFKPDHFDYIVIDETHRAGAESYKKILDHFKPNFLLGMTATPERSDGFDIFKLFDYNIAYEIRLHRALEENMLIPFHYYGVTDISVDGKLLEENSDFKLLTASERIDRVIEKAKFYSCDDGNVRGLVFCSNIEECKSLSEGFNRKGLRAMALTGENSENERVHAIQLLESDNEKLRLDYIFTVDIFNEGIDIPRVNQIVMLRPTQSAIVFVQQLGRGLRKIISKDYLTVIDFIGNYKNNFLVPIALYGDTSYSKDSLRKMMASGSSFIPGTSTVNFDRISRDRIFESIDSANMMLKRDLVNDYRLLKFKLGHIPMMIDFLDHGSRDPILYVNYARSYFNFVADQEDSLKGSLGNSETKLLELFSNEINNSKRLEESLILKHLINNGTIEVGRLKREIENDYEYTVSDKTIDSCLNNLNFGFITENKEKRLISVKEKYSLRIVKKEANQIVFEESFRTMLTNSIFREFLIDNIEYSIQTFNRLYNRNKFSSGFILYRKYSRKDVFRILNWGTNPIAQNVGGYIVNPQKTNCPIFVNYHKEESISSSTKYEDGFISNSEFEWMSKSKRTLNSPDVKAIINYKNGLRLPLFIKKNNDEGTEFYYMGDVTPKDDSFVQTTMPDDHGKQISVVKVKFSMNHTVEDSVYDYLTASNSSEIKEKVITNVKVNDVIDSSPFRILSSNEVNEYINCIPLYDIKVAAGNFSELQNHSEIKWVQLIKPFRYTNEYFICRVIGESMNKIIPNGSWCLFKKYSGGSREGKIVLVQHTDIQDTDFGAGFTVKLYHSNKVEEEGKWRHESIVLEPRSFDPKYGPIVLTSDELGELKVIGVFNSILS